MPKLKQRRERLTAVQRSEALMFLQSAREKIGQIPDDEWPPDYFDNYGPRFVLFNVKRALDWAIKVVGKDGSA